MGEKAVTDCEGKGKGHDSDGALGETYLKHGATQTAVGLGSKQEKHTGMEHQCLRQEDNGECRDDEKGMGLVRNAIYNTHFGPNGMSQRTPLSLTEAGRKRKQLESTSNMNTPASIYTAIVQAKDMASARLW